MTSYIAGEKKLADGAKALKPLTTGLSQVSTAIDQMYAAMDGEGGTQEDLKAASSALAAGTAQRSSLESLSDWHHRLTDLLRQEVN